MREKSAGCESAPQQSFEKKAGEKLLTRSFSPAPYF
jgi:hypothetical protein